ncbi:sulfotransferase [Pikeienuella piscinae]|uniref:Sulfotransferase n=1 Tax=Pikeienuella piscinae TaxID=2748098 RepID=A0A7L5BZI7_9RHOB|nr:sulfotransferase [Pikeienuella piscinae]QIE55937.1 sulfotransferase [Pikeienuella piscinae]
MFQDEICRHPDVRTVQYSPHSNLETHWWLMAAVLLGKPGQLFNSGRPYDGYGGRENARAYMIDLLAECAPDFSPPLDDRALVFDGWEALCRTLAQPVFFEKSPQFLAQWAALSLILEWMQQTTFDVKIIGLVRNPHGTMYSAAALFGTDPATRQFGWLEICRNLLVVEQMLPADRFMKIRYEDLIDEKAAGFADICQFIGVPPIDAVGSGAHGRSTDKWRRDVGYRLKLDPAVRQMARHLGYSDADLDNPNAADAGEAQTVMRRNSPRIWFNRRRDRFLQPMWLRLRAMLRQNGSTDANASRSLDMK